MKNFSQNSVKTALCGVVGSERNYQRVWDSSQQAKSVRQAVARTGRFTEMGTRFLCLLRNLSFSKYGKEGKRMDWELEIKDSGYLPEKVDGKRVQKVDIVFNFVGEINFLSVTQPKRQGA